MAVDLNLLLKTMLENSASDLHIRSGTRAYLRVDGNVRPIDGTQMTAQEVEQLAFPLMREELVASYKTQKQADFALDRGDMGRFRCNLFIQRGLPCLAIRHIPSIIPSFTELNLPAETMKKICSNERGLVLLTGITGSGKTSTLASMIDYINAEQQCHVITIEDPIEFVHKDKRSVVSQRELGTDTPSFVESLRGAMRQDPDVILVGEMRDLETMRAAVTAAETGHLVFGTVHTINAYQTVSRILDLFLPHQQTQIRLQLASSLKAIVSQRLLPCTRGGRIPAVEILIVSPHVKKLIEENQLEGIAQAIHKGAYYGMVTFNQSLVQLHKQGLVTLDNVLAAATNPDDVMLAIRGIEQESDMKRG